MQVESVDFILLQITLAFLICIGFFLGI